MKIPFQYILPLFLSLGLLADPAQQIRDMISMTAVVEGKVVQSIGTTNTMGKFGTQPGTWFFIYYTSTSESDLLRAGGQSYKMTWAYSGNMVQVIPRSETVQLQTVPGVQGRLGPESAAELSLSQLAYRTRFGLHIADTNLVWNGLEFSGVPLTFFFPQGSKISGRIEVSNSLPVRINATLQTPRGVSSRITELSEHDTNGFPRVWRMVIDGNIVPHTLEFTEISFDPRKFPDSEGYTPSLFGERGREFAIYYSNRTQHVVGPGGEIRKVVKPSPLQDPSSLPWWIGIGGVTMATAIALVAMRFKGRKNQ